MCSDEKDLFRLERYCREIVVPPFKRWMVLKFFFLQYCKNAVQVERVAVREVLGKGGICGPDPAHKKEDGSE